MGGVGRGGADACVRTGARVCVHAGAGAVWGGVGGAVQGPAAHALNTRAYARTHMHAHAHAHAARQPRGAAGGHDQPGGAGDRAGRKVPQPGHPAAAVQGVVRLGLPCGPPLPCVQRAAAWPCGAAGLAARGARGERGGGHASRGRPRASWGVLLHAALGALCAPAVGRLPAHTAPRACPPSALLGV